MELNELRIGNYYWWYAKGKNYDLKVRREDFDFRNDNYKNFLPIPLTEEWLINFGFEHREFSFDKGSFFLMKRTGKQGYLYQAHTHRFQVKYVHQLQNLFFANTQEELTHQKIIKT